MRTLCLTHAILLLAACSASSAPVPDGATVGPVTVITGGTIYTGNPDQPMVEAVVFGPDGRILATVPPGSSDWSDAEVNLIDLQGAVMFPGFTDSHIHLLGVGARELTLNLEGTASIAELVTRLEAETSDKAPGSVVFG